MFGLTFETKFVKVTKKQSFRWKIRLSREGKSFIFPFTMGAAHCRISFNGQKFPNKPLLKDVLECLQNDCSDFQSNISYKDWASNFGYNPDSIKGKKIFRTCRKYARKMERLLGLEWKSFLEYRFDEN